MSASKVRPRGGKRRCWLVIALPACCSRDKDPLLDGLFDPGHGSVTLALQMIEVNEFDIGDTDVDIGSVSTRSAYLELEYAVASAGS